MLLEIALPFILLHHNVSYYGTEKIFNTILHFFTYVTLQSEFGLSRWDYTIKMALKTVRGPWHILQNLCS